MQKSLLLGCGNDLRKKMFVTGQPEWAGELVTLDMNPHCLPTVLWNLEQRPLPFKDQEFDEMGAYDVLEHIGRQGDWKGYFDEFAEYWRILKPGGLFGVIVPVGVDVLADPGHTRFFSKNYFGFLTQKFYTENLDAGRSVTDYRWYISRWWEIVHGEENAHHLSVLLRRWVNNV